MRQLIVNVILMILILMYIKFNESKPFRYDDVQLGDLGYYIDRSDLLDAPLLVDDTPPEEMKRLKRNCFLYAMKLQNRAPKWMCW